jgi:pimeloyl-ACP methyl ester carboxylesterase
MSAPAPDATARDHGPLPAARSTVDLPSGRLRYRDVGDPDGEPVLLVHGLFATGDLWNAVAADLADDYRCLLPDLPLGAHVEPMPDADPTPTGVADLLADLLDALDLDRVTVVGNDTGGAVCQLFLARHPERVARLVLTNCDAYDQFLPLALRPLQYLARVPGPTWVLVQALRLRPVQRRFAAAVAREPVDDALLDAFFDPAVDDPRVRRDLRRFLAAISPRDTNAAAESFPAFDRPVLVVWGRDDPFFSAANARRLAAAFPDARLEFVDGSRAFVPLDRPDALVDHLRSFLAATPSDAGPDSDSRSAA